MEDKINMQKNIVKKGLTIAVIFLFVAVSFQPVFAINSKSKDETADNKSNNENKLEYIIEITKENKVISYSVFLTEKEANDLDILIESIHSKLNNSKSNDDTINIFYDTVDSFNDLGIFPDNISINEVKQLVTGENRDLDEIRFKHEISDGFQNRLCLVASETTNTFSIGPIFLLPALAFVSAFIYASFYHYILFNLSKFKILPILFWFPGYIIAITTLFLALCSYLSFTSKLPVSIGSLVTFGRYEPNWPGYYYQEYYPSYGWISTIGLFGIKNYNGSFYGRLFGITFLLTLYSGIVGFTGISIRKPDGYIFRQGFALHVKINSNPPGVLMVE